VASRIVEELRNRIPYIRRLHRRIDELQHRLAALEAAPLLHPAHGSQSGEITAQFRAFLRHLRPYDVVGPAKRRFGADLDGGYVMLDDFGDARTALSLGIGEEVSWDADMARRGLRVFQFDHTVEGPPQQHPNFMFHRTRVVGARQTPADVTLEDILARGDVTGDVIAKIDVEGFEWEILAQTGPAALARVRQLAMEFHDVREFTEGAWRRRALAGLENLARTHACIHVHGNNWAPFTVVGGTPFPNAFEATFVRRSDYQLTPSTASFPTSLDRPCNPKMPDLYLGHWEY
jgi:hypothetical protein